MPNPMTHRRLEQIKRAGLTRYQDDELADVQAADKRPKPTLSLDDRVLLGSLMFLFRCYGLLRSIILFHICGFVPPYVRSARLGHCLPCSFCRDRGDGVMICVKRQRLCTCPAWLLSCLFWLTRFRRFACPLGRFKAWSPKDAKPLELPAPKAGCGGCLQESEK